MNQHHEIKQAIQSLITDLMERVIKRVIEGDPFDEEEHRRKKPLYAALIPDEIFKGSHFERRFVTPFGSVWEQLALEVAKSLGYETHSNYHIVGQIQTERLHRIAEVLNRLEHRERGQPRVKPDWNAEIQYIRQGSGIFEEIIVIADVLIHDTTTGIKRAFELKSPLPNSDITKVSKEKLLKLHNMEPLQVSEAYFALPYNPFGRKAVYNWSFSERWFDMNRDHVILIGDDFWDKIGGEGTYDLLLEVINEIGGKYKDRIYREFLKIEPPQKGAD